MIVTSERLTLDEFLARDFPPRTQLVNGEVVVNPPRKRHDRVAFRLAHRLAEWAEHVGTGEAGVAVGWSADDRSYFVPDAWWIRDPERVAGDELIAEGYADIVIEVRSPSTWRYDIGPKRSAYERAGVAELWFVDLDSETVVVNRRSRPDAPEFDVLLELGRGEVLESPQLPRFAVSLDELFDR
ncbi:MAG TPA: Uma2 family endonuclease [Acidimicrobiia bacterium]|nr:Uma2 family endonuclease [Acidimicrobiia bacterium]